jgi:hypothetical protein
MRQQTIAVAGIAAPRQSTAETAGKRNAVLIPGDRAALSVVEAHSARTGHILATRVVMHLRAGSDAVRRPCRVGPTSLDRKRHARLIPTRAATGGTLVAYCVAA